MKDNNLRIIISSLLSARSKSFVLSNIDDRALHPTLLLAAKKGSLGDIGRFSQTRSLYHPCLNQVIVKTAEGFHL